MLAAPPRGCVNRAMMTRISVALLAGLALASTGGLTASPAQAQGGAAWHAGKSYIHFPGLSHERRERCSSVRRIMLAQGVYKHTAHFVRLFPRSPWVDRATTDDMYIRQTGWYSWKVCWWFANGDHQMSSTVAGHTRRNTLSGAAEGPDGWYEFGARLQHMGDYGGTTPSR